MKKQVELGLTKALEQMLSKNSNRFTAEEVETLKMAIVCSKNLQRLEKKKLKEATGKSDVRKAIEQELLKLVSYLLHILLYPEIINYIGDHLKR